VSYIVMARKYRPRRFADVVGQEAAATILKNAICAGKVGHAYLFAGERGVGKTSMARIFAKAINCLDPSDGEPCNKCEICAAINMDTCLDYMELDAASNRGIDDIRELRSRIGIAPAKARYKVYVLDEVHMLTKEAANAFLKTLEEPPPHAKFILATTEPDKLFDTILSRCQRFDFRRIAPRDIVRRLEEIVKEEKVELEPGVLSHISRRARGSMRDAQSFLDQICSYATGRVTLSDVTAVFGEVADETVSDFVRRIVGCDPRGVIELAGSLFERGYDLGTFVGQLVEYLRDLMVLVVSEGENEALLARDDVGLAELKALAEAVTTDQVLYMVQLLGQFEKQMRYYADPEVMFETACVKMAELFAGEGEGALGMVPQARTDAGHRPPQPVAARPASSRPEGARQAPPKPAEQMQQVPETGSLPVVESTGGSPSHIANAGPRECVPEEAGDRSEHRAPTATLAQMQQGWENALEEVGSSVGSSARMALDGAELLDFADGTLTLAFGSDMTFWRQLLDNADGRRQIEDALSRYYGFDFKVRFVTVESSSRAGSGKPAGKTKRSEDAVVNRVIELFDGQLIEMRENRHVQEPG